MGTWIFVPKMMILKLTDFVIFPAKILQLFQMGYMINNEYSHISLEKF